MLIKKEMSTLHLILLQLFVFGDICDAKWLKMWTVQFFLGLKCIFYGNLINKKKKSSLKTELQWPELIKCD